MNKQFDHVGIVSTEPHDGECWVPFSKVWVTNPRLHPQRIEYVRPLELPQVDPRDVGLWKLWHLPHVAYRVDDLEEAMAGEEVIFGPFEPGDFGPVVFVHKDGGVVEYLQYRDLTRWFGQLTPWKPAGPGMQGE
jgi:hypothetical protein